MNRLIQKLGPWAVGVAAALLVFGAPAVYSQQAQNPELIGTIPTLKPPAGLRHNSSGGHGYFGGAVRPAPFDAGLVRDASSIEYHYRLVTDISTTSLAEHYATQLTAHGWTMTFKQFEPKFATARFSSTSGGGPLIGTLSVVPFKTQRLVSVRLINPAGEWRNKSRSGGGGAGASQGVRLSLRLLATSVLFPTGVTRIEFRNGGGNPDYEHEEVRLDTNAAAPALMSEIVKQQPKGDWSVEATVTTPVEAVSLRRSESAGGSQLLMLVSMPGRTEVDLLTAAMRDR